MSSEFHNAASRFKDPYQPVLTKAHGVKGSSKGSKYSNMMSKQARLDEKRTSVQSLSSHRSLISIEEKVNHQRANSTMRVAKLLKDEPGEMKKINLATTYGVLFTENDRES